MNNKKKVMICQPMRGLTDDEILGKRQFTIELLTAKGYEVIDTFFKDNFDLSNVKDPAIFYLSKSIEAMSTCDAAYFCEGWEYTRGCLIEHEIAEQYGLEIIYEV